ncbi:hypothetical protein B0A52_05164 [Exophiala mesophila]|uniref:alcohol dehydrogenase (NADP(+)) n=1 Tax=Exophiala mesophila TaxID=212818 RepID=A0A438N430_EXOME|nr:hypothetical protein B0A52_05164 [Exophiala mesophila]
MSSDYKFQGWLGLDPDSAKGQMVWQEFEPKTFDDEDIDIKITHCGICGSDLHTLRSGWGPTSYPLCVGHEIVGRVVRVGTKVKDIKLGDRVGVGAQSYACQNRNGDCEACADDLTPHCPRNVNTYGGRWPGGSTSQGGYADYWRGNSSCVIKIPDQISSEHAAPMLCGGITACRPLFTHGAGPGKKVGIIGIGGLGHFGIMGAKALGCSEVVAISRTASKKADAMKMGATKFIATDEDRDWARKHSRSLDLIVCTVSSPKLPLEMYLQLLRLKGAFVQIGAPEDVLPPVSAFSLMSKACTLTGSLIGSPNDIRRMLNLFVETGVRTWNNNYSMRDANKALIDFEAGRPRYRLVLVNEKNLD